VPTAIKQRATIALTLFDCSKMIVASIVHRKVFTSVEYILAISISLGLIIFAAADWELTPSFHPSGLAFVSLSVCADAILPNAQERLFRLGSSRLEVTVFTNVFTLMAMTLTTVLSGDFFGLIAFSKTSQIACLYMGIYTFIAYIAISIHMTIVRRFGGVAAVLVATGRKGMTLVISFIIFPKGFSWFYIVGAILVLGGLLLSTLFKIQEKKRSTMVQPLVEPENNDLYLESETNHQNDLENGSTHKEGKFISLLSCLAWSCNRSRHSLAPETSKKIWTLLYPSFSILYGMFISHEEDAKVPDENPGRAKGDAWRERKIPYKNTLCSLKRLFASFIWRLHPPS
jgi:hypothetical protein